MKIVHIIPTLRRGGAERLAIDIVRALAKLESYEVRLLIFRNEIAYVVDDIQQHIYHVPAEVSLSFLRGNRVNTTNLQNFLNDFNPDIIHSHLFEAEIVSRSCYYPNASWFSHCHDKMIQFKNFGCKTLLNKSSITNFYEKRYLINRYNKNSGNTFIAISKDTFQYFTVNAKYFRTIQLPNAINIDRFIKKTSALSNTTRKLRLVNTGTFDSNKNQRFLVDVAKCINDRFCDFELHFLGDGEKINGVKSYSVELGLADKVFFHGSVENVEQYLWNSDIYVHSAKSEALGLTLIEAMAAGLPVVTLDGKGNRDLIEVGKNGFILDGANASEFASRILEIWNNKKLYVDMSDYARSYAQKFNIDDYIQKLTAIYQASLKDRLLRE